MNKIKTGDVVHLKSGGSPMTVVVDDDFLRCKVGVITKDGKADLLIPAVICCHPDHPEKLIPIPICALAR